ncbi:SRPBCC domain-containing protein [Nonomuraea sp. NPDC049758]|uniref:SRPBCC domain-containing protein n=1 Tax=Nonomuraea sp. NPDC049758 TaxID=3154360 RepID=UPI00343C8783
MDLGVRPLTARYWGHANVSDWRPGSPWEHRRADGSDVVDVIGEVIEAEPPARLVVTFDDAAGAEPARQASVVTFLIEPHQDIVRLTVTHEDLPNQEMHDGIAQGWPGVPANLKSLLETGEVLPQAPWEMHPGTRLTPTAPGPALRPAPLPARGRAVQRRRLDVQRASWASISALVRG